MKKSFGFLTVVATVGLFAVSTSWAGGKAPVKTILAVSPVENGQGNAWGTYRYCFVRADGSFDKAAWFAFKENPANRHLGPSNGKCPGGTPGENPGTPGNNPGTPGDNPGTPGDTPGTPGDTPSTPGDGSTSVLK